MRDSTRMLHECYGSIVNLYYEHEINRLLVIKSWVEKHIPDNAIFDFFDITFEFSQDTLQEEADSAWDSLLSCLTPTIVSHNSKEELEMSKIYGRVFYIPTANGEEYLLTQTDIEDGLKSFIPKDHTLRALYEKYYEQYEYLIEDLRIDKAFTTASASFATYFFIPAKERYRKALLYTKQKLFNILNYDQTIHLSESDFSSKKKALITTFSKFYEIAYEEPSTSKSSFKVSGGVVTQERIEIIESMVEHNDDIEILFNTFRNYRRDTNKRVYNFDLIDFLYFDHNTVSSIKHLKQLPLLKRLKAYKYYGDKISIKHDVKTRLKKYIQKRKTISKKEINYIENLINTRETMNTKHINVYYLEHLTKRGIPFGIAKKFLYQINITFSNNKKDSREKDYFIPLLPHISRHFK